MINSAKLDSSAKIDNAVYEKLAQQDTVRVFVYLKDNSKISGIGILGKFQADVKSAVVSDFSTLPAGKFELKHDFGNSIAVEISAEVLEQLRDDARVERIEEDLPVHAFLQDSVPWINATLVFPIKVNGANLTGENQTVCVIDTGVNYSNADLGGCFGNNTDFSCKVIAGYDYVNNDKNPDDDNGHGTHVAGIIAANGTIKGVAPGAKIVAVKVLDADGNGFSSDLVAGVQWCVDNSTIFNISVISMSLGTVNLYRSYCDNVSDALTSAIDNATARNITVVAATGNDGSTSFIANPACIRNVTSVGAVSKSDAIEYNRNNITTILAPGVFINATRSSTLDVEGLCSCSGNYCVCSGTSMATPHVAGAIALLKQYKKLEKNESLTTLQIKDVLNRTGKRIFDSGAGLTFSRLNVFAALLAVDGTLPNLTLAKPQNTTYTTNISLQINFSASDNLNLSDCMYSIDSAANISLANCANFTFNTTFGSHTFAFYAIDSAGNINYTNITFFADQNPIVNLMLPLNSTLNSTNATQTFSCNASDGSGLQNVTLFIWDSADNVFKNVSNKSGETYNQTNFSYALPYEGIFKWNCRATDNSSGSAFAGSNYTVTFWDYNISACRNVTLAGKYTLNTSINNSANAAACINITASDVEIDCVDFSKWIDGADTALTYGIKAEGTPSTKLKNITVRNCNLTDWHAGIYYNFIENSTIANITSLSSSAFGIFINSSSSNKISNITAGGTSDSGIFLSSGANYNTITNITSRNNILYGIYILYQSNHNWVSKAAFINNSAGFVSSYSINNTLINATYSNNTGADVNATDTSIDLRNIVILNYSFTNTTVILGNTSSAVVNFPNITVTNGTNLSSDVVLRNNYIFVNSSSALGLNKSANISFYSLTFNNPRILRNGAVCPASICSRISYASANGTLIFNVTGFSYYSAEDYCGNGYCDNGEGCSSCSSDCGACSVSTSSGGGGGGGGASAKTYNEGTLKQGRQVNRLLGKNDRIKFELNSNEHSLTLKNVGKDNATFELNSSSLKFNLLAGESIKFNLSDAKFYDFAVVLNNISNSKANLSIIAISEIIPAGKEEEQNVNATQKLEPEMNITEEEAQLAESADEKIVLPVWIAAIILAAAAIAILLYNYYKNLKEKQAIERVKNRREKHAKKKSRGKAKLLSK
ncbi:MAG: S8 family serine peptidase [archaeon]